MPIFNQTRKLSVTPTLATGGHAANDVVGGLITLDVASAGGGGTIRWVQIVDDGDDKAALNVHFFDAAPASINDDAAFVISVADMQKRVGVVRVEAADYASESNGSANNASARKTDLAIPFVAADGRLYAYIVNASGAPVTYAASDITLQVMLWLD